jgi:hypothetical protein
MREKCKVSESPCTQQSLSSLGLGGDGGFGTTPTDFADAPTGTHCTSVERCGCSSTFKAQSPFIRKDKCNWIEQLDLTGASKGAATGAGPWNAEVVLDGAAKQITVTHKMIFVNLTGHRNYGAPFGVAEVLNDAEFKTRAAQIPVGIKAWWNAKPYKIRIRTRKCGEETYKIFFDPQIVTHGAHYIIDLYNVPYDPITGRKDVIYFENGDRSRPKAPQPPIPHPTQPKLNLGRSFVMQDPSNFHGSWSLADTRTCTDTHAHGHTGYNNMLEPHEFAHMLGLLDAYYDADRQINGLKFHTRGDLGSAADDHIVTGTSAVSHPGMLGNMTNYADFHKAYALTVAFVIIRHMNEVWGHKVEDWEILA